MDIFQLDDFNKLCRVRNDNASSIYLTTHKSGVEVNEGIDRIAFKNKVYKIRDLVAAKGFEEEFVKKYMHPFFELLHSDDFWKSLDKGLAVFATDCDFYVYRLPVSFEAFTNLSNSFTLTPLLPLADEVHYFLLALEQEHVALYRCTKYTIEQIEPKGHMPHMKEVLAQYQFSGENVHGGGFDFEDQYLYEFSRDVNKIVLETLHDEKAPLVVAGAEYFHHIYSNVNSYRHLLPKGLSNPSDRSLRELHEESLELVKEELEKALNDGIGRYKALAGSGETSYDLETLVYAALDGRIEQSFIEQGRHIWGTLNQQDRTIEVHDEKLDGDINLVNLIACTTIEDKGKAFLITKEQQPEKEIDPAVLAVFRY